MANLVLEFDVNREKVCRFIICNHPDEYVAGLSSGDEIGFDLVESKEFFYATISRKVYLVGKSHPIYVICIPHCFNNLEELSGMLEKFKAQFKGDLAVDV